PGEEGRRLVRRRACSLSGQAETGPGPGPGDPGDRDAGLQRVQSPARPDAEGLCHGIQPGCAARGPRFGAGPAAERPGRRQHRGTLDYVAPEVDATTGTLSARAILPNADHMLLPGFFARVRVPLLLQAGEALLVPDRALGTNQAGNYLLVLNKDDVVEQRNV